AKGALGSKTLRTDAAVVESAQLLPAVTILVVDLDELLVGAERQCDAAPACGRVGLQEEAAEEIGRPVLHRDVGDQVRVRKWSRALGRGRRGGGNCSSSLRGWL